MYTYSFHLDHYYQTYQNAIYPPMPMPQIELIYSNNDSNDSDKDDVFSSPKTYYSLYVWKVKEKKDLRED